MDIFDKKLLFVTGKGGVGKTTVSLALGLAAAGAGKRTIVCEVGSQEAASRIFGKAEIGFHEVEVRDGLFAISIDPEHSTREYLELQLPVKAMSDLLYRSKIFSYLAAATPGLKEMVTMGKIEELANNERRIKRAKPYDLVIVDAPATGHGIGLMQTPRNFAEIAKVGPMANQADAIDRAIKDHRRSGVVIVALPEEMPVNESAGLERELTDRVGMAVDRIYMNSIYPKRFDPSDIALIDSADREHLSPGALAALSAASDQATRRAAHQAQLERLIEMTRAEVSTLPHLFAPSLGTAELDQLAGLI